MPVPESSFRRYGGREDSSSSYATYSSSRVSPSNRSSYLYNSKLTSTLPPRPSYERKASESSMPVSRFLNTSSSTSIPRSSASYISTSSSSRTLSPIRNSVSSYRRTFEGAPSVTDRIKSLEIGGLDKELTNGTTTTTSRFLQRVRDREREREASIKPFSSYGSRDRSGSREFGSSPLSASPMILRERFGSEKENHHHHSSDYPSKFDLKVRAASVMGRASSPTPSSPSILASKRNGYTRLGSTEVIPTSSCSDTTTTTTSTNSSSKSVPVVVATAATNNAIATTNNAAADAIVVENGVLKSSDETNDRRSSSRDLENENNSCNGALATTTSAANIANSYPSSTNSSSLPPIVNNRQEQSVLSLAPKSSNKSDHSLSKNSKNDTVELDHKNIKSSSGKNSSLNNATDKLSSKSRAGSKSPEKDSNGNTIVIPINESKEKVNGEKVVIIQAGRGSVERLANGKLPHAHKNSNDKDSGSSTSSSERLNNNNNNSNVKSISTNNLKTRRSSSTQTQNGVSTTQPKVIYHAIKLEQNNCNDDPPESHQKQKITNPPQHVEITRRYSNSNISPPRVAPSENNIDNNKQLANNNDYSDDELQQHTKKILPNLTLEENQNQIEPAASSPSSKLSSCGGKNNFNNQDKVKQLIRSLSRSPSPATSSSASHLPSINNTCNNLVNGEAHNNVDEMEGPHASKHLKGGGFMRPLNGVEAVEFSSKFEPMSTSNGVGGEDRDRHIATSSTQPRNHFNNSSDSSDNDSDGSSPQLGGRFRTSRDKEKGLTGLRNIGNTCFMNSVIQCLSNTKPLLEYLVKDNYLNDINSTSSNMRGALMRTFASVIQELWNDSKSVVDTSAFKDQIQRFAPRFMGYSQQDAQEFLRYLLEGLHEDVNRVTSKPKAITTEIDDSLSDSQIAAEAWKRFLRFDDSKLVDLFVGQFKSTLKCTVCGHCSVTFDPFWDLSLPIPSSSKLGQVRLSQCLELFTREEVLDGDEKPTCAKCQARRKCTKSLSIQKFPKVLVIHLKRFSPMERYRGKLSTTVDFPMNGLDMGPYAANRGQGCTYNLYGVSNHSGSTYSGHYIAYCKHPYSGEWFCYNDSRVSSMSTHSVVSSDGYLLFYELASQSSHL